MIHVRSSDFCYALASFRRAPVPTTSSSWSSDMSKVSEVREVFHQHLKTMPVVKRKSKNEWPGVGLAEAIIELDKKGSICSMTGQARSCLCSYFGASQSPTELPDVVKDWLAAASLKHRAGQTTFFGRGLVVEGPSGQLKFRLAPHDDTVLLILEERTNEALIAALDASGLTRREAEILSWIIKGKSNWEVSRILSISPRTVQKHLERVFEKLGVESRLSASHRALQLVDEIGLGA